MIIPIKINEKEYGERLFCLKDNQIKDEIRKQIKSDNSCFPNFFIIIIRYLIFFKKLNPIIIQKIMFRYSVIFSSLLLKSDNPFMDLLLEGLEVDTILKKNCSSNNELAIIFNNNTYSTKLSDSFKKEANYNIIYDILLYNVDFFHNKTDIVNFIFNSNRKTFDLIIAQELAKKEELIDITFLIDNENRKKMNNNIFTDNYKPNTYLILFIIYEIINNNYKLENINLRNKIFYQILSGSTSKMSFNQISFLLFISANKYSINLQSIKEFDFTMNDINYTFSRNGLIKL